ncbi:serine hydrolase domain-containing protein [Streptomyces sp. NPDC087851]|uniref:serine hydrolase domain-containing protein n=1 Tax=Streptomyces sp. NPDC087851 TaxID=3365810 RepID=UPI0038237B21
MTESSARPLAPASPPAPASPLDPPAPLASRRLSRRVLLGGAASAALVAAVPARAYARSAAPSYPPLNTKALQAAIDDLENPRATGAQLRVGGTGGRWYGTSGVADLRSGRAIRTGDQVRAGSISKAYIATAVLQLVGERRLVLEAPVQRYLPDLLPAEYPEIRLSHLLNHTSGLPDESGPDMPDVSTPELILAHRYDRLTPSRLVARVTRTKRMKFDPGTKQEYRGISFVLLAMVVERVTGRSYGAEIRRRIARPLGLTGTYVPASDDPYLHGPHVHGYQLMSDGRLEDATVFNQSAAYGSGEMVSTTRDVETFLAALFAGELLPPHLLEHMFTLPPPEVRMVDGTPARYSAGLQTVTVNGVTLWGKTGERYGYHSGAFGTLDRRLRLVWSYTPVRRDAEQGRMAERIAAALTS